ncbi:MAG TPA: integrase arm-type DNA-binding domain-containing protein, partial [Rhodanobacteraceae bacterium]|nr:integrase arm-type DNA-binding domain-containing protein [Rhodanobacteraceae bacterium]
MLTDTKLKALKARLKPYRVADAGGLCIEVHPGGSRYWRYRYRFAGKAKLLSLGVYPEVSLAEARRRRDDARRMLQTGTDPSAQRKQQKLTAHLASVTAFEPVAREWLAGRGKLADTTRAKIGWMLETYVFPWIGSRPIGEITAPELLAVLRRLESLDKLETTQRLKQVCGQIFRYAIATGRAERDPAADLR